MAESRRSIHGEWSSRLAFILAAAGAAIGLGNIWKFPYIAGMNGGGAFVLVYLICVTILGIPIMMSEIMIGRLGRQNPGFSIRSLSLDHNKSPHWKWIGYLMIVAGFLILSYYSVITGWALDYIYLSVRQSFAHGDPGVISYLFDSLVASPWILLFWHTIVMVATTGVVAFGVEKGIERSVKFLLPTMVILLLIVAGYSVSTGYFGKGFYFLFHPNFHEITPNSILIALGHAFFTLSIATGSIMMYGAYLPEGASIPKATMIVAVADTAIALLAGLAIFPIVFAHGLQPEAGPGLIFKTLPIAFGKMPYGYLISTMFFMMLELAAFTSAISLLEPSVAWAIEQFRLPRKNAAYIMGFIAWFIGLGTVLSFNRWSEYKLLGKNFFSLLDYLTANILLPLGGLLIAIFAGWILPKMVTLKELNFKNGWYYKSWRLLLGIVSPIGITIVFLNVIGIIHL